MKKVYFFISMLLFGLGSFAQCPVGNQIFNSQVEIDNFGVSYPLCTALPGNLTIDGSANSITNLEALSSLTTITGQLNFYDTDLVDLSDLGSLVTVGGLNIDSNEDLVSLDGLENLISTGAILSITLNSSLTDIDALANLPSMATDFTIADNPELSDCAILSICVSLTTLPAGAFSNNGVGCTNNSEVAFECESVLPVTLVDFKVKKEGSVASLTWNTASEVNSSRFLIERSQTGKIWRTVGSVTARGPGNYSYTDDAPASGVNFYRLKMVDLDETFAYSKMHVVRFEFDTAPYPNPVADIVMVRNLEWSSVRQVQLYNSSGTLVLESEKVPSSGLDVSQFSSGLYTIRVTDNNGSMKNLKIVKK